MSKQIEVIWEESTRHRAVIDVRDDFTMEADARTSDEDDELMDLISAASTHSQRDLLDTAILGVADAGPRGAPRSGAQVHPRCTQ